MEPLPTAQDWERLAASGKEDRGDLQKQKEMWDEMSSRYAHKRRRGGYLQQLIDYLSLEEFDSLYDMGCGPGVVAIPMAKAGHRVIAVDFSDGMLAELRAGIAAEGVEDRVQVFQRAWQQDWDGIPEADIVLSSRSMSTDDYADAVAKMESKAKKRVFVSTAAGDTPWQDSRFSLALGRKEAPKSFDRSFVTFLNFLLATNRLPRVRYIVDTRAVQSDEFDELVGFLARSSKVTPEEEPLFRKFVDEHVVERPGGGVMLDYTQTVCWALLDWEPRR